jgi:hypothetical protein
MIPKFLPSSSVPVLGGSISDEERRAAERANADQFVERLVALFKHYEVDPKAPDADSRLLLRLARDLVPGFEVRYSPRRGRGRTKKWGIARLARLLADVASITREGKHRARAACRILTEHPRFAARYGHENFLSLYARYEEAGKIVRADKFLGMLVADAEAQAQAGECSLDDWFFYVFSNCDE